MQIYNTLTRRKEEFVTLEPGRVRMYVCGPNLYGPSHVGHAMSYIIFDTIRRYLEYRGFDVKHIQNFTDIEDRIIETAKAQGTTIGELAQKYIDRFHSEMDALNVRRATYHPRATEVIPQIIEIVEKLIEKGYAYPMDGDVYFRVQRFADYGKLSNRALDKMEAGARIEIDERKEHPMDFALWKASKEGEPAWESPWGMGRPGWHIECSAMSMTYLGEQIDIHGGGQDVVFPHHENEIAQSEAYSGKQPFARYWIHNGLLQLGDSQEKMTRHLGNIVSIREALERYSADGIRVFVLSSHYRGPSTWSDESIKAAERGVERLRSALRGFSQPAPSRPEDPLSEQADEARARFISAMDDDLNTPQALAQVYDLARVINQARDNQKPEDVLAYAQGVLKELTDVLGLTLQGAAAPTEVEPFIALLVSVRTELRAQKQWALADDLRKRLAELGVILEDTAEGTKWKYVGAQE